MGFPPLPREPRGFVLACAATARLNDTYWRTTGAILLAGVGGLFFVFTISVIVWRISFESHILWLNHDEPDWKRMWAGKDRGDGDDEMEMLEIEQDEFRMFRNKQEDLIEGGKGPLPATPGFVHAEAVHNAPTSTTKARGGADLAAMLVPAGGGHGQRPTQKRAGSGTLQPMPLAPAPPKKTGGADLELFPAEPKPMDEYNRTKRWFRRKAREAREGRSRLALWWRDSLLRRRLRLFAVWMNWERGVWVVDPRKQTAQQSLWTARNFRWTFDAFFEPYRGDNFGKWFGVRDETARDHLLSKGDSYHVAPPRPAPPLPAPPRPSSQIWDLLRKLASGLAVGIIHDPDEGPDGPAYLFIALQLGILIAINGLEVLYVLAAWPFKEWVENYVQLVINGLQLTVLGLLLAIGGDPTGPNVSRMALAASIIQIVAIGIIFLNQFRAERKMFRFLFQKIGLLFRYIYRKIFRRGPKRPAYAFGPGAGAADGAGQRGGQRTGDAVLGARTNFGQLLFGGADDEEEEINALARQRVGAGGGAGGGRKAAQAPAQTRPIPAPAVLSIQDTDREQQPRRTGLRATTSTTVHL
eukprot:tig00000411_g562.t1